MAVINDEKLGGDQLLSAEIVDDAMNAMRFLPEVVTSAIETTLARVYDVDPDELSELLYPEA
jgi:methylglyoxal synthase